MRMFNYTLRFALHSKYGAGRRRWEFATLCIGNRVFEPYKRRANRIQRAGHICHRQEHHTNGKLFSASNFHDN